MEEEEAENVRCENEVGLWKRIRKITRKKEAVTYRLRAGYTKFSQGYSMREDEPNVPPVCAKCHNAIRSVKHVLVKYPSVRDKKMIFRVDMTLRTLLNAEGADNLIKFLKDVNIL